MERTGNLVLSEIWVQCGGDQRGAVSLFTYRWAPRWVEVVSEECFQLQVIRNPINSDKVSIQAHLCSLLFTDFLFIN